MEIEAISGEPVHRAWDLGMRDDTSVWFWQVVGSQIYILDHYAISYGGLEHFRDVIEAKHEQHGWRHGTDWVPPDAKVHEMGSSRTRVETMIELGLKPQVVPKLSLEDGRNAVRRTLPLCVFHPRTEVGGIDALEQYRREWDDEKKAYRASHVHDWTSHPADAFRYLSCAWRPARSRTVTPPPRIPNAWIIPPPMEPRRGGMVL